MLMAETKVNKTFYEQIVSIAAKLEFYIFPN